MINSYRLPTKNLAIALFYLLITHSLVSQSQSIPKTLAINALVEHANQLQAQQMAALIEQKKQLQRLKAQAQKSLVVYEDQALRAWGLSVISLSALVLLETSQQAKLNRTFYFLTSAGMVVSNALAAIYRFQLGSSFDETDLDQAHANLQKWIQQSTQELKSLKHLNDPNAAVQIDAVLLSIQTMESQLAELKLNHEIEFLSDTIRSYQQASLIQSLLHSLISIRVATKMYSQRLIKKPRNQMSGYLLGAQILTSIPSFLSKDFRSQLPEVIEQMIAEIDKILITYHP